MSRIACVRMRMRWPEMSTVGASLIFLLAYAAVSSAFYPTQPPVHSGGFENRLCTVPFGFRPRTCGMYVVVSEVYEPACEYLYGPNVCLFTATVRTNVTEYRYRRGCDWVRVPSYYGGYTYRWQCSHFICQPTHVCLDETQEFNRSYEQCCPGFAARPPKKSLYNPYSRYLHYNFYNPIISDPVGCPVAVADSLLECMEIQGLDDFISYIQAAMSDYLRLLNTTTDFHLTAFVPTNAALRQAQEMNLIQRLNDTLFNLSMMVGNHLVEGNVTIESLKQHGAKIYTTLEGRHLHRVSISFDDRSFVYYPPNPYLLNPTPTIIKPFINGAEVVIEDACKTENGTLHIIDRVLVPVEATIAGFLQSTSRFSMFAEALNTVGLLRFLDNPNVSRTVFAIPDDAFMEAFPEDLRTCISNYLRLPFNNLLLFHISDEAHYTSSLSLKTFLFTLLHQFMEVEVRDDDVITLGECRVPIIEPNIRSLSNGVVHAVERPIFPESFSFGMCDTFVPSPSPAECPEPPSPSPTMVDPRVSPIPSMGPDPTLELPVPTPMPTDTQAGIFQF